MARHTGKRPVQTLKVGTKSAFGELLKVVSGIPQIGGSKRTQDGSKRAQNGFQRSKDGPQKPPKGSSREAKESSKVRFIYY